MEHNDSSSCPHTVWITALTISSVIELNILLQLTKRIQMQSVAFFGQKNHVSIG